MDPIPQGPSEEKQINPTTDTEKNVDEEKIALYHTLDELVEFLSLHLTPNRVCEGFHYSMTLPNDQVEPNLRMYVTIEHLHKSVQINGLECLHTDDPKQTIFVRISDEDGGVRWLLDAELYELPKPDVNINSWMITTEEEITKKPDTKVQAGEFKEYVIRWLTDPNFQQIQRPILNLSSCREYTPPQRHELPIILPLIIEKVERLINDIKMVPKDMDVPRRGSDFK